MWYDSGHTWTVETMSGEFFGIVVEFLVLVSPQSLNISCSQEWMDINLLVQ